MNPTRNRQFCAAGLLNTGLLVNGKYSAFGAISQARRSAIVHPTVTVTVCHVAVSAPVTELRAVGVLVPWAPA
jgi:hypothetical protein